LESGTAEEGGRKCLKKTRGGSQAWTYGQGGKRGKRNRRKPGKSPGLQRECFPTHNDRKNAKTALKAGVGRRGIVGCIWDKQRAKKRGKADTEGQPTGGRFVVSTKLGNHKVGDTN